MNTFALRAATYDISLDKYTRSLLKKGIKRLGRGGSAEVFQHPTMPSVAVKVFDDEDLGFIRYLRWCLENQHNKYALRVFSSGHELVFSRSEEGYAYSVVFVEKLSPCSELRQEKYVETLPESVRALLPGGLSFLECIVPMQLKPLAKQSADPELSQICQFLIKAARPPVSLDFGIKNFMLRGSQLVFIDPLCV